MFYLAYRIYSLPVPGCILFDLPWGIYSLAKIRRSETVWSTAWDTLCSIKVIPKIQLARSAQSMCFGNDPADQKYNWFFQDAVFESIFCCLGWPKSFRIKIFNCNVLFYNENIGCSRLIVFFFWNHVRFRILPLIGFNKKNWFNWDNAAIIYTFALPFCYLQSSYCFLYSN